MELLNQKELISRFYNFFDDVKKREIQKVVSKGEKSLEVSFFEISEYDYELGDQLLEFPEDVLKIMEETLTQFYSSNENYKIKVRITSLPISEKLMIREIRSEHINKLVIVEGLVRRKTDVRPKLKAVEYLCTNPDCPYSQEKLIIPQTEEKAKVLKACPRCRSPVAVVDRVIVDSQNLVLEEIPEHLENSADQPKRINVLLQEDLVSPFRESKTNPGSKVYVIGMVREIPLTTRTGAESINYDVIIEGNYIALLDEDYSEIKISKEEEEEIKEIAHSENPVERLVKSIAPSIHGNERIKEAILLQLFGGKGGKKGDGTKTRGDIHVLLLGDPGAAKSQLLKAATRIAPKASFVSGKSASAAGLCIAPNSLLLTEKGEFIKIKDLVENNFENKIEYKKGIFKEDKKLNINLLSSFEDYKIKYKSPSTIWKLETPEKVFKIVLRSGKEIEITGNTSLYVLDKLNLFWKKSKELKVGDKISVLKKYDVKGEVIHTFDILKELKNIDNLKIYNFNKLVDEYVSILLKKGYTKREISKLTKISENKFYLNDSKKPPYKLKELKNLINLVGDNDKYKKIDILCSLYNGKFLKLPKELNSELLYLLGVIYGDGDLKKTITKTFSFRISNKNKEILKEIRRILEKLNLNYNEGVNKGVNYIRFNSRVLGEIFLKLGLKESPKSSSLDISNYLSILKNEELSFFLRGLFDTDGSINYRKSSSGSCTVELYSCSKDLIYKIQLLLLRFGIYSSIRKREPTSNPKITGNLEKFVLTINSYQDIKLFYKHINFFNKDKKTKLEKIIKDERKHHTNLDSFDGFSEFISEFLEENNISKGVINFKKNNRKYSRKYIKKILNDIFKIEGFNKLKNINKIKELYDLVNSDLFFEEIKSIEEINPKYKYVYDLTIDKSHNFVANGILVHNTATVIKDDLTKGWALEAGAMVLASGGLCAIDELDKMSEEDTSAMHEALEQQTISIAKANIRATLKCETTVLGAANPKYGRFDPYGDIAKQINFPPALISRFDLIFILRDVPDKKKDELIASHILETHMDLSKTIAELSPDFLKKYISYAKEKIKPVLTNEAKNLILDFYVSMRNAVSEEEESGNRSIPITARQLEAIIRLSEAYAKIELSQKVKAKHAQRAIDLLMYCLRRIGIDPKTGQLDIDRITTGITTSSRNLYKTVMKIIDELSEEKPKIYLDDIIKKAKEKGIEATDVENTIIKLKQDGLIFEPRKGEFKKIE
jgi:replicative DNA helicase Mcm